jgi:hypothetical protein
VDVAQQLAISPDRVRDLVHGGQLDARRVGRELLVDAASVYRRAHVIRPAAGRPLSPRMSWGLLWWFSGVRASWLPPAERSRLRKYAARLALEDWPRMPANRADVHRARMLPGPLKRLREGSQVAVGGVSAAVHYGLDLMGAVDDVELYVGRERFQELVDAKRINLAPDVPNVLIRVPRISSALAFDNEHIGFAPPAHHTETRRLSGHRGSDSFRSASSRRAASTVLMDLADELPKPWTVIGGQIVNASRWTFSRPTISGNGRLAS